MKINTMEIGKEIKRLRKEKGLTSRELAEMSGVSQPYISQLETGRNNKPSIEILEKIFQCFYIKLVISFEKY